MIMICGQSMRKWHRMTEVIHFEAQGLRTMSLTIFLWNLNRDLMFMRSARAWLFGALAGVTNLLFVAGVPLWKISLAKSRPCWSVVDIRVRIAKFFIHPLREVCESINGEVFGSHVWNFNPLPSPICCNFVNSWLNNNFNNESERC